MPVEKKFKYLSELYKHEIIQFNHSKSQFNVNLFSCISSAKLVMKQIIAEAVR